MKTKQYIFSKITFLLGVLVMTSVSCEREPSDAAVEATYPTTPEVFIDGFSTGLEYLPFNGSVLNAFSVDDETKYKGTAAMRFDVPNLGDPEGSYAGAIFPDYTGRDLSGYDALTFWAKSSQMGTINEIGFGNDFGENKYQVTLSNLLLSTNWRKYIIPIPDASKLVQEKGLFWYAEGPENGAGYSFWVDELKFEKLGTIAQPEPAILNGNEVVEESFIGANITLIGLTQTFNLASGINQTVTAAPSYFTFNSSDTSVATVSELGIVTIIGGGTTVVTAVLDGVDAVGSLTITSLGDFTPAPVPTEDPINVISVFSNAYNNEPVDYYNGYWAPYQTTQGQDDIYINGDDIIKYTDLNFVGIQFAENVSTINASQMTHFHIDIQVQDAIAAGDYLTVRLQDFGVDNTYGGSDDTSGELTFTNTTLVTGNWVSLDIPLSDFATLTSRSNLAQVVLVSDATITNVYIDNIYFYAVPSAPTTAAPTPTDLSENVISLFSDAYTDVTVDTWITGWSAAATVLEDITVNGNATKKYTDLGFVGIETTANTVDASSMTYFHLDVWSPDFTSFNIKLVDFGADNAFGGGDDTEHEISISNPNQGQWLSLDIPLSDFTGLTATANMAQYILVAQPYEVADVFVDNVYFHN